jgi:hypothetical protein
VRHLSHRLIALAALGAAVGRPATTNAQQLRSTTTVPAVTPSADIDPEAVSALEQMGTYLRTLKAFQVKARITTEEVLVDGQKVQLESVANLVAEKPDKLRLEVTSANQHRLFFYDGKNFTLVAPRSNYYATVAAPATIPELATKLEERFGIDLPFVDLFRWGTSGADIAAIKGATDVGPSVIDGVTVEQYAFCQDGFDWQIWIQDGDFPLPLKLVITTLTDEARPQHASVYTWNLAPSVEDSSFTYVPAKDMKLIKFVDVTIKGKPVKKSEDQDK